MGIPRTPMSAFVTLDGEEKRLVVDLDRLPSWVIEHNLLEGRQTDTLYPHTMWDWIFGRVVSLRQASLDAAQDTARKQRDALEHEAMVMARSRGATEQDISLAGEDARNAVPVPTRTGEWGMPHIAIAAKLHRRASGHTVTGSWRMLDLAHAAGGQREAVRRGCKVLRDQGWVNWEDRGAGDPRSIDFELCLPDDDPCDLPFRFAGCKSKSQAAN